MVACDRHDMGLAMKPRAALACLLVLLAGCNAPVSASRSAGIRSIGVLSTCAGDRLHVVPSGLFGGSLDAAVPDWNVDAAIAAVAKAALAQRYVVVDAELDGTGGLLVPGQTGSRVRPGALRTPRTVDAYLIFTAYRDAPSLEGPVYVDSGSFSAYAGAGLRGTLSGGAAGTACFARVVDARTFETLGLKDRLTYVAAEGIAVYATWQEYSAPARERIRALVLQAAEEGAAQQVSDLGLATEGAGGTISLGEDTFIVTKGRPIWLGGAAGARSAIEEAARETCARRGLRPRPIVEMSPRMVEYYMKFQCVAAG